jgi:tRNA-2-methylthio-N6-dimethylallyladenosine synthase
MSLVKQVSFESAYSFIYSPRDGTPAADMEDNVPMEVKKERLQRLNRLLADIAREKHENLRGSIVEVLIEGVSKNNSDILSGRTRTNKLVHLEGPKTWIGSLVQARVIDAQTWYIKAEIVDAASEEAVS